MTQEELTNSIDAFKEGIETYKVSFQGINRTEEQYLWEPLTHALETLAAEVNALRQQ